MRRRSQDIGLIVLTATLLIGYPPQAAGDEIRTAIQEINTRIQTHLRPGHRLTLGHIRDVIEYAISIGAPIYNAGRHQDCFEVYVATARGVIEGLRQVPAAEGHDLIKVRESLEATINAMKAGEAFGAKAWAVRYAFDETLLTWKMKTVEIANLVALGDEYSQRRSFDSASRAYQRATDTLREVVGDHPEHLALNVRIAPLALGNSLFAQEEFVKSVQTIRFGLSLVPDWGRMPLDLRHLYQEPAEYDRTLQKLTQWIAAHPTDGAGHFLLGYQYYFSGEKTMAQQEFERALQLDQNDQGAKYFLSLFKASPPQPPSQPLPPNEFF